MKMMVYPKKQILGGVQKGIFDAEKKNCENKF
jgi:hypothetical protein